MAVCVPVPPAVAAAGEAGCVPESGSARVRPGHGHDRNHVAQREVERVGTRLGPALPGRVSVPVVFHVVHASDGTGNVSNAAVNAQLAELNQDFSGREAPGAAADTEFSFTLQAVRRHRNNAWFSGSDSAAGETAMKTATRVGSAGTLNIWSTDTEYLGYATFPWWYADDPKLDGVVIQYGSLPGGRITDYNLGKTASHETGHWLGLYHTFQGGCSRTNDQVADTPAQRTSTEGCPRGKNTCPAAGADPVHNYMDYSFDACYNQFTAGQKARMQNSWLAYRS
ncbi:hypothetical protein BU204_05025 [Actinophytocola xanthii]|uniref:Peptidase M43 pregnancy-associated plasma-A domain-containing protein n=2 Tax=Actinophytocola xanthii TaxID=1912961 RepID=A0A1Q8CWI2_9PSEU|nr:hypothetical protein BU204_05025 [Actinophytocola xanthii]